MHEQPQYHQEVPQFQQDQPQHQQEEDQPQQEEEQPQQEEHPLFRDLASHVCSTVQRYPLYQRFLKTHNHGNKIVEKLYPKAVEDPQFFERIIHSGLAPLVWTGHKTVDNHLLSAFVERWHSETSSFHLPFGEMTITLDDVSMLLHLPITGNFFRGAARSVTQDDAISLAVAYLGVTREQAIAECRTGPYYRFGWLEQILAHHSQEGGDTDIAVRAYLLLLLSWSIFTSKTGDRAEARWLLVLDDLDACGQYAWGAAALVHLYDELSFSSVEEAHHLAGYASLLQAWIVWRFPTIAQRRPGPISGGEPLCGHWVKKKTDEKVVRYRTLIDELTSSDVVWRPFEDHRPARPFHMFSLFRGWLSWDGIRVPYMPDRCLRQFGYVQVIPDAPLRGDPYPPAHDWCIIRIGHFMQYARDVLGRTWVAEQMDQVGPGYLQWYISHSLPRLLPPRAPSPPPVQEDPAQPHHESPPRDGAPVPEHYPPWIHDMVRLVREGLRSGHIDHTSQSFRDLYDMVGFPPYPPAPDHRGPGRHPRR